jgi:7,8-dihydropterin-6-yl-methyl-4-(beta-D-ribofuranosyl)aminobenzene 5'-phosphate synthase
MWSIIMTLEIVPVVLDELVLTVVVDNATDNLSSVDSGIPQLPEVVSLLGRIPATRHHEGHDAIVVFDQLCVACHGLSVLVQGRRGAESHTMLFDVGPYGDVWIDNAERLNIDLASIETIVLSHWHWDHSGGLPTVIAAIAEARRRAGRPDPVAVDLHPDRPDQRGIAMPSGTIVMFPEEPTPTEMNNAGGRVELHDAPHLVNNGYFAVSGLIDRVTSYETGLEGHVTFRGDLGRPDPLILDERFVAAQVRGRGVSVLSACSHAGIVNVCLAAQCQFPGVPIDVVVGGYHLAGAAMERRIPVTVDDLDRLISPRVVAPAHCTGWRAAHALAERFSPGRFAPSTVGSRYTLTASHHATD